MDFSLGSKRYCYCRPYWKFGVLLIIITTSVVLFELTQKTSLRDDAKANNVVNSKDKYHNGLGSKDDNRIGWGSKNDNRNGWGIKDDNQIGWGSKNDNRNGWGIKDDNRISLGRKDGNRKGWGIKDDNRVGWGSKDDNRNGWGIKDYNRISWGSKDGNRNGLNIDKYQLRSKVQRLPRSIIVGVKKCGTRALWTFLSLHPQIVAPIKEPKFFNYDETYYQGLDYYRQLMPPSYDDQITMEKTSGYFSGSSVPQRVRAMNRTIKLLLVVRDPVTRIVSDYTHFKARSSDENYPPLETLLFDENGNINKTYTPVSSSTYHVHFKKWLDHFPMNQFHIVDGQNFIENPAEEIAKVETFLGIEHKVGPDTLYFDEKKGFFCMKVNDTSSCLKDAKGREHPYVKPEIILKLKKYFEPLNEIFFDMVNRRFDW